MEKLRSRRSYFRMPRGTHITIKGKRYPATGAATVLLMLSVVILVYATFLVPQFRTLECGEQWNVDYVAWELGPDELSGTTDDESGTKPVCDPDDGHIPEFYQRFAEFMPLFVWVPLGMLMFRRTGSPGALAAMLLALTLRELIPGDGVADWAVLGIGALCAAIPVPINGIFGATGHIGGLMVWPVFAAGYAAAEQSAGTAVSEPVAWVMEFTVWVLLLGGLIIMPLIWGMGKNTNTEEGST